ncbi:DNA-protecting protein DprA [Candidatus Saccharibacteria bacterium]|nr:MAG: DNA-protecting protein DprA [Candidatus Saccharibacteria bacterium]
MHKINEISPLSHKYLQILECIDALPDTLYHLGSLPTERRPSAAIVGSRKPTAYGREVTQRLAGDLARRGVVIVSGLALGVDALAHRAALEAGGTTIAVQANGLHRLYPTTNRHLGEQIIAQGGAILSEYEPGADPLQHRFLERNRIISGLADVVIVTEAASRSGTLNTAAHALTQGKELFALPGNITSPMSAGCNYLLRQGATPVTSVDDILQLLVPTGAADDQAPLPLGANPLEQAIIDGLASGLRDGDELLARAKADPAEFSTALTMLEIAGIITPLGANQWTLR